MADVQEDLLGEGVMDAETKDLALQVCNAPPLQRHTILNVGHCSFGTFIVSGTSCNVAMSCWS